MEKGEAPGIAERISAASRGDAEAVESLLARYLPDLVAYLGRRAGGRVLAREAAEDLAQSVCREVLGHLRQGAFAFRGEPAFREWLYRAALLKVQHRDRHWRAQRREAGREAPWVDADPIANEPSPSQMAAQHEELERFEAACEALPERQREVLRLFHGENRSHGDIAAALGISEANSRMLLSRALARLASHLTEPD